MAEFLSADIEKVENGYQVAVRIRLKKPSKKEITEMSEPMVANVDGDTVIDRKEFNASTLEEAIDHIKNAEKEDKNDEG